MALNWACSAAFRPKWNTSLPLPCCGARSAARINNGEADRAAETSWPVPAAGTIDPETEIPCAVAVQGPGGCGQGRVMCASTSATKMFPRLFPAVTSAIALCRRRRQAGPRAAGANRRGEAWCNAAGLESIEVEYGSEYECDLIENARSPASSPAT